MNKAYQNITEAAKKVKSRPKVKKVKQPKVTDDHHYMHEFLLQLETGEDAVYDTEPDDHYEYDDPHEEGRRVGGVIWHANGNTYIAHYEPGMEDDPLYWVIRGLTVTGRILAPELEDMDYHDGLDPEYR